MAMVPNLVLAIISSSLSAIEPSFLPLSMVETSYVYVKDSS
jgi:hypothetical protein